MRHSWAMAPIFIGLVACGGGAPSTPPQATRSPEAQWVATQANPVASTSPTDSNGDLAFLGAFVGTSQIVGLGEATHGSSEFQRLKHRLFRRLVEQEGFNVLAMETTMAEAYDIDRYVQTGVGDPGTLVAVMGYWPWNTQEVVDLVTWMAAYNQRPGIPRKVHFVGVDDQSPETSADHAMAYLQSIDGLLASQIQQLLAPFLAYRNDPNGYAAAGAPVQADCRAKLMQILDLLDAHQTQLTAASSALDFAWARRFIVNVLQGEDRYAHYQDWIIRVDQRNQAMADNAVWAASLPGFGHRTVLWAHDGHIATFNEGPGARSMGYDLKQAVGTDYVPISLLFDQGGCNALPIDANGNITGPLTAFQLPPAAEGSFEATFTATGLPIFALDLRNLPATGAGPQWIQAAHLLRWIGSVYDPSHPEDFSSPMTLAGHFEAVFFIRQVTATHYRFP